MGRPSPGECRSYWRWWLILCLAWLPAVIVSAQQRIDALGVLVDNSGSMKQNFDSSALSAVTALVREWTTKGQYDTESWDADSVAPQFNLHEPLWQPGVLLYVHNFGQVVQVDEPFFRIPPYYEQPADSLQVANTLQQRVSTRLDFGDKQTNIRLARYLAWWEIQAAGPQAPGERVARLLIISDWEDRVDTLGVSKSIENAFVQSGTTEQLLAVLNYKRNLSAAHKLQAKLFELRWNHPWLHGSTDTASTSTDSAATSTDTASTSAAPPVRRTVVKLKSPGPSQQFDPNTSAIMFSWDPVDGALGYRLVIDDKQDRKRILDIRTKVPRYSLNLVSGPGSVVKKGRAYRWRIEPLLSGENAVAQMSDWRDFSVRLATPNPVKGLLILLLIAFILALIAAAVYFGTRFMPKRRTAGKP